MEKLKKEVTSQLKQSGEYTGRELKSRADELLTMIYTIWGIEYTWEKFAEIEIVKSYLVDKKTLSNTVRTYITRCGLGYTEELKKEYMTFCEGQGITTVLAVIQKNGGTDNKKDWEGIIKRIRQYEEKKDVDIDNYMKYYISKLYTLNPPLILSEWIGSVYLENDDGKTSHVNTKDWYMKIYSGTNSRKYWLSPGLIKVMKDFRDYMTSRRNSTQIEWVIPSYRYEYGSNTSSNLSNMIKSIFGMTMTDLRVSYRKAVSDLGDKTRVYTERVIMGYIRIARMTQEDEEKYITMDKEEVLNTLEILDTYMGGLLSLAKN